MTAVKLNSALPTLDELCEKSDEQLFNNCLPSARQHAGYGDCLEVKREYCQNCSVLDCMTQCSQSAAHLHEQFLQVQQIEFVTLGPLHCV